MTTVKIFTGTVLAAAPDLGLAIVYNSTDRNPKVGDLFVAFLPLNSSELGSQVVSCPVAGETVNCVTSPVFDRHAYIVGCANWTDIDTTTGNAKNQFHYNTEFTATDSEAMTQLLDRVISNNIDAIRNRAHSVDRDQYPGDYAITNKDSGAGLFLGRLLAQLRGSPLSYIELSKTDNKITMIGEEIGCNTFTVEHVDNAYMSVHNVAISAAEAFGIQDGKACISIKNDTSDIVRTEQDTLPLYRMQHTAGGISDGVEDAILGFPDAEKHTCKDEPPILAKTRQSLSGQLAEVSALGLCSVKTPYIPTVLQTAYTTTTKTTEEQDIVTATAKEAAEDAVINKLIDKLLSSDYIDIFKTKLQTRGLSVASKEASILNRVDSAGKVHYISGPTGAQAYDMPPSIQLTDPVTGLAHTYYASTSFISQEPNGDILIADGYGSEIRMSMGNIFISPALDCFIRSGRDTSIMAGRYQSYNSQNDCTINASKSMYVRSNGDLKIAGAMHETKSGDYTVTLESGALNSGTGGMVIKSSSKVSLTGTDIYIGRNAGAGLSDTSVEDTGGAGGIIIDSGNSGVLSLLGQSLYECADELTLLANTGTRSCLSITSSAILLLTKSVACTAVVALTKSDDVKVNIPLADTTPTVTIGAASTPQLQCAGDLLVSGSAKVEGSCVVAGSMAAVTVASTAKEGLMSVVKSGDEAFKKTEIPALSADIAANSANLQSALARTVYNDNYVHSHRFYFPEYGIGAGYKMPGMLWQSLSGISGITVDQSQGLSQGTWKETYIQNPMGVNTAVYPGADAWENGTITLPGYKTEPLNKGYRINVTDEENKL